MKPLWFTRLTTVLLVILALSGRIVSPAYAEAPSNDGIANAIELGFPGSDATNTFEATEGPEDAGCWGGPSIWYRFAGVGAAVQVNTFGSDFDTVLSVFSGSPDALALFACSDDAGGSLQSSVDFFAESGMTYFFLVQGFGGSTGNVVISTVQPPPPPVPFSFEISIDTARVKPSNGVVTIGGNVTCTTDGWVDIWLTAEQRAGRSILRSDAGYVSLSCDETEPVSWSVQLTAGNGIFKAGAATLYGQASGYGSADGSGSWYTEIGPTSVRLTGAR